MSKYVYPSSIDELIDNDYSKKQKGKKFEDFLYHYLSEEFDKVLYTNEYDKGVDLIVYKYENPEYRIGIQAKNYSSRAIMKKDIQAMNKETEEIYYVKEMRLFTTSTLNEHAKQYCKNTGIEYYEHDEIEAMISEVSRPKEVIKSNSNIKTQLYKLRNKLMIEFDLEKPHYVFSYKTINELLDKKPTSLDELYDVHGFRHVKVARYGNQIIDLFKSNR